MAKTNGKNTGAQLSGPEFETKVGEGGELHQIAPGSDEILTTQQGVPVADDQNILCGREFKVDLDAAGFVKANG